MTKMRMGKRARIAVAGASAMALLLADGGPTFGVPRPDGWNRVGEFESDMIPLAFANQGLSADGFTPTTVLTIGPSQVGGEQEFDRQLAMVEQLGRPGP